MKHTQVTAPTQFVEANGVRYAYRRFGNDAGFPLVLLPHLRAGMDDWDPMIVDGFASGRPVILFNNAGVASSSGQTPDTIEAMSEHVTIFLRALGLSRVDVLGFSIGGCVAQIFALRHPTFVRRLILVSTCPAGLKPPSDPEAMSRATGKSLLEDVLHVFFTPSPMSQAAGRAFWDRRRLRRQDVDPPTSSQTMAAQMAALEGWRQVQEARYHDLETMTPPTLVVNGNRDVLVPAINAYTLSQRIPNALLIIYPDSGHGALFQYPTLFLSHALTFLDA